MRRALSVSLFVAFTGAVLGVWLSPKGVLAYGATFGSPANARADVASALVHELGLLAPVVTLLAIARRRAWLVHQVLSGLTLLAPAALELGLLAFIGAPLHIGVFSLATRVVTTVLAFVGVLKIRPSAVTGAF